MESDQKHWDKEERKFTREANKILDEINQLKVNKEQSNKDQMQKLESKTKDL